MKGESILHGTPAALVSQARERAGKSQRQIEKYAGIARTTVSRIENNQRDVLMGTWAKLVEHCGYDIVLVRKGAKVCSLSDWPEQRAAAKTPLRTIW